MSTNGKILTTRQRSDLIASLNAGADALEELVACSFDVPKIEVAQARARRLRRYARDLEKDQKQAVKARRT